MKPSVRVLERVSRVAPLGVRFLDEVTGRFVGEGLLVSAYPQGLPTSRRRAVLNRSGVHILMDLPGLRDLEFGEGNAEWWSHLPSRRPYIVEVQDEQDRFLPFSFQVDLPHPGLFQLEGSPLSPLSPLSPSTPAVPLFSAPTRQVASTLAVLRAELWDAETQAPAAWAVVEAMPLEGTPVRGMADAQGRLALFFQYPAPVDFAPGSPADASALPAGPPLRKQAWTLRVRAFFVRQAPVPESPDLRDTLSQPPARLWPDTNGSLEQLEPTLRYGRELTLCTQDEPRSRLWITPTGSTP